VDSALRDSAIPHKFPGEVETQSNNLPEIPKDARMDERTDLRKLQLVTIDGESARDFDDAVYCEEAEQGGWRLWVAIADVSSYVDVDSPLDQEARLRGTSVYFPEHVVPMLPHRLSDGLCSLAPNEDRLCMVCEMTIGVDGVVSNSRFYEAVMCSHRRLTYEDVADLLGMEGRQADAQLHDDCAGLLGVLESLYRLYKTLAKRRRSRGAIDFDATEYQFSFDEQDLAISALPVQRHDAHRLIEECMLAANVAAARFLGEHKLHAPYRVHPPPTEESVEQLRNFLKPLGFNLPPSIATGDIQKILKRMRSRPEEPLVHMTVLRAMSKAVYTTDNIGHFGLCYESYTHFTSPIRRYPDLLVHRAIRSVIRKQDAAQLFPYGAGQMSRLCEENSAAERRADEACRTVSKQLACSAMTKRLGDQFDGIITGVTHYGLFVHLSSYGVDGLAHISDMRGMFVYQPHRQRLISREGSRTYRLGDKVKVLLARIQPAEAKMTLELL
jgi:ribonuclease R